MPRDLDAILAAAVKLIDPREGDVEAFQAQLKVCIDTVRRCHQEDANVLPLGQMKKRAAAYLDLLQRVRKAALQQRRWTRPKASDDFTAALDQEINQVDATAWGLDVPIDELGRAKGSPQRNVVADVALIMARDFIDPDPYRHPENRGKDLPVFECPWRRRAAKTKGGVWLRLAALIYESATGKTASDSMMMKHCREVDTQPPRYLVKGLRFQA
jgi:hypothetical protein